MKIGIDISQAQYQGTGVGTYTFELVQELLDLGSDHEFILFGGSLRGLSQLKKLAHPWGEKASLKIWPLPPAILDRLFNGTSLPIEMFTGKLDVFHSSDWTQPSAREAKLVTTIHDLTTLKYPQHHHPKVITTHQRRLEKIKQLGVKIMADSQATADDLVTELAFAPSDIEVVHLAAGQDFTHFMERSRIDRTQIIQRVKQKYSLDASYILSVGTREPRKNIDRVIQAFVAYKKRHKNSSLQLVIAGKYGWGEKTKTKIQGLETDIRLVGFVPQADLPALYRGSEAFVYPSLYEGFGLPVLEAMTVGTPVITSQKGSLKEVAGQAAVLVDPYSVANISRGIDQALDQSKELKRKGLIQAKHFSWRKTALETLKVYESL